MNIEQLSGEFAICKLSNFDAIKKIDEPFTFLAKTDQECSLVCKSELVPNDNILEVSRGWRCFRVNGVLDFSLVGILARISSILADNGIAIFAVSTFNTDYIFVKASDFIRAIELIASLR